MWRWGYQSFCTLLNEHPTFSREKDVVTIRNNETCDKSVFYWPDRDVGIMSYFFQIPDDEENVLFIQKFRRNKLEIIKDKEYVKHKKEYTAKEIHQDDFEVGQRLFHAYGSLVKPLYIKPSVKQEAYSLLFCNKLFRWYVSKYDVFVLNGQSGIMALYCKLIHGFTSGKKLTVTDPLPSHIASCSQVFNILQINANVFVYDIWAPHVLEDRCELIVNDVIPIQCDWKSHMPGWCTVAWCQYTQNDFSCFARVVALEPIIAIGWMHEHTFEELQLYFKMVILQTVDVNLANGRIKGIYVNYCYTAMIGDVDKINWVEFVLSSMKIEESKPNWFTIGWHKAFCKKYRSMPPIIRTNGRPVVLWPSDTYWEVDGSDNEWFKSDNGLWSFHVSLYNGHGADMILDRMMGPGVMPEWLRSKKVTPFLKTSERMYADSEYSYGISMSFVNEFQNWNFLRKKAIKIDKW